MKSFVAFDQVLQVQIIGLHAIVESFKSCMFNSFKHLYNEYRNVKYSSKISYSSYKIPDKTCCHVKCLPYAFSVRTTIEIFTEH